MPNIIYWHIQMNQPWGSGGGEIDSSEMLEEVPAVIGTGQWNHRQYNYFINSDNRGLKVGDIVLVREGITPLALCKVVSDYFEDANLTRKYHHQVFRNVSVISFYKGRDSFPMAQGTLNRLTNSNTTSWKFINNWYLNALNRKKMEDYKKLLEQKKQIILQGPPGTGKTYTAMDVAYKLVFDREMSQANPERNEQIRELESSEQFRLIQFHPSFTYEDFVRGISAKPNGDNIEYKVEERILGKFANAALKNLRDSKKSAEDISIERWLYDKTLGFQDYLDSYLSQNGNKVQLTNKVYINRTDENSVRYKSESSPSDEGVPFTDLVEMYLENTTTRREVKEIATLSGTAKHRSTYWLKIFEKFKEYIDQLHEAPPVVSDTIAEQKFVLIVDEINRANLPSVLGELIYALEYRNKAVQSLYEIEGSGNNLVIPSNLYIIGTMNTADRSVGHIDYAIRRRFAFIDVLPDSSVISNGKAKEFFYEIEKIFDDHLAPDFEKDQVMLGHSYFLAENSAGLKMKLRYEVYPILKEYINDGVLIKSEASLTSLSELLTKINALDE